MKKIDIFCYSSLSQVGIKQGMTGSERNDEGMQYTRLNVYVTLRRRTCMEGVKGRTCNDAVQPVDVEERRAHVVKCDHLKLGIVIQC